MLRFADCLRNVVADNKFALQFFGGASAGDALGAKGVDVVVAVKRVGVEHVGVAVAAVAGDGFFLRAEDARGERVGAVFERGQGRFELGGDGQRAFGVLFVVAIAFGKVFQIGEIGALLRVLAVRGSLKMGERALVTPQRGIHAGKGTAFFGAVGLGGDKGFQFKHPQQAAVAVQRVGGFYEEMRVSGFMVGLRGRVDFQAAFIRLTMAGQRRLRDAQTAPCPATRIQTSRRANRSGQTMCFQNRSA